MAASGLECIKLHYLQKVISTKIYSCDFERYLQKKHRWLEYLWYHMASDHITFVQYGLWSYRIYIIYKYWQIIQSFVADNLEFWGDKCTLKLRDLCWHSRWKCQYLHKVLTLNKKSHWWVVGFTIMAWSYSSNKWQM